MVYQPPLLPVQMHTARELEGFYTKPRHSRSFRGLLGIGLLLNCPSLRRLHTKQSRFYTGPLTMYMWSFRRCPCTLIEIQDNGHLSPFCCQQSPRLINSCLHGLVGHDMGLIVLVTSLVTGLKSRGHQFDPGWGHLFCFCTLTMLLSIGGFGSCVLFALFQESCTTMYNSTRR